ncbi:hypothetical protein GJA_2114 [Janthinobacterium agaricidamnosum NBRC 102515 = DSM 9628]|uniref:Uncharacterized protein n=1 Tax=Janthinobacterium agaricidamnosum NBRC 102515 = DSM 9628 TaxID=1349767 RepID=W0V1P5_9BURK|nr:hypothetical protein GJA_2114 [Janthinobacterium agaricidamnosum NBRC 102515 = DSM 9628]
MPSCASVEFKDGPGVSGTFDKLTLNFSKPEPPPRKVLP